MSGEIGGTTIPISSTAPYDLSIIHLPSALSIVPDTTLMHTAELCSNIAMLIQREPGRKKNSTVLSDTLNNSISCGQCLQLPYIVLQSLSRHW
jgi:hypothetical protein